MEGEVEEVEGGGEEAEGGRRWRLQFSDRHKVGLRGKHTSNQLYKMQEHSTSQTDPTINGNTETLQYAINETVATRFLLKSPILIFVLCVIIPFLGVFFFFNITLIAQISSKLKPILLLYKVCKLIVYSQLIITAK